MVIHILKLSEAIRTNVNRHKNMGNIRNEFQYGCIPIFYGAEVGNTTVCRELLLELTKQQITVKRKVCVV